MAPASAGDVMADWVCTTCGSSGAQPQEGFHLMDERYAVGFCDQCNDPHPVKPRKTPRPLHHLVRADLFERERWAESKDRAKLQTYVQMFGTGKGTVSLTDMQIAEFVRLYDRFSPVPGFALPAKFREVAVAFESKAAEPPKKKRR